MTLSATTTSTSTRRGLHVITWGCQMNVYDSARMSDVLRPLGYEPVDAPDHADMIILNTCHIREKAVEKVFSELGRLRNIKNTREAEGKQTVIAVAGCVAQAEGQEILSRAPYVDIVMGPQTYHRLPEMVARAARAGGAVIETDFPAEQKFDFLPDSAAPQTAGNLTAFLTIQEGCDKFCSFCVVPYTRGAESSRPVTSVIAEARRMVESGVQEISLLGQNVNAYHGEGPDGKTWGLADLAYELAKIPGLTRIRYATSHPRDMDDSLINAHRDLPELMPFLHLPVQSGSDRILTAMNRGHTADEYREIIKKLRDVRPDMALSSDFIVGHPGETDEDFEQTMQLVRDVGFALAYSFKYSQRPGTPAAGAPLQVPEHVKDTRLQALQALLRQQQDDFAESLIGQTISVLLTGKGRKPGQITGRSPWLQPVHITGTEELIGQTVSVTITERLTNSLNGIMVKETVDA
ncbi:tRNA (N6-isopentenyl adenosine(37)-C2)-methylthiotransferase MiaB [Acetobacter thailandicus]|uniref:tRNA-2-methylthio-N(6)-dimethylallyladenosine synthase n=1 Tax=Acetobacter thailandicus TaxID=1502842 RepID=A0ABT3QFP3_9PROT|nr:tRNA (N6-isopentenyl adenosine(37)-C2)-methylthiotransferase MiaB [Acetobacter thailandicus]MBS0985322.1 tRNA (N6-isopentenyl adenosine(37)-C2)-methylthiotransferase MiaB [Acetobacter thailandicus]MCX2564071.1 tRNA (N6-isopentenyl adenosine(37)-C2)-methylthiotransferase MiaB [Acetobacter thailandicus]NHN96100.1 tRNA (N6-isopentenyl adenosine(37)-C2)-methylthiotransferase MiaB [Acetobacter thailandicus]